MGMLNWLALQFAGKTNIDLEIGKDGEEFSGLNLKSALEAHRVWEQNLLNVTNETSHEQLDAADVGRSDLCTLGRWIAGAGDQTYGRFAEYRELRRIHAKLHLTASAVVIAHNIGNRNEALRILNDPLRRLSDQVQLELIRLFAKAKREG